MADSASSSGGKGEPSRKGGSFLFFASCVLFFVFGVFTAGLLCRPYLERELLSDEASRQEGALLLADVTKAILDLEERQRQEVLRLSASTPPRSSTGEFAVPVAHLAEWSKLTQLLKDLNVFKESLKIAQSNDFRREVVATLQTPIREKLRDVELPKTK
jgi:hypothetical protein